MRTRDVRILDDAARKKRREKWVEALHKDNFQNDKGDAQVQILEQVEKERVRRSKERKEREILMGRKSSRVEKKSRKTVRGDHFKTRFRKTFEQLVDEEEQRIRLDEPDTDKRQSSYKT